MSNRRKATSDRLTNIRAYLEKKNKPELVALLLDLVQEMNEPTRQRFWEHLAPPGMATADLRYPSAEDFLSELESFAEEVLEGEYYDEEAATYYGEDNYSEYEDYDPEDHAAIKALRGFFHEADSYFDSGQFAIAAQAYDQLLDLALSETDETLGLPTPLEFLEQDERQVVSRLFTALQASRSQNEFFDQALYFQARHENQADLERFLELVGDERALQTHLEAWADRNIQNRLSTPYDGLALQLRLLLRFYEKDGRLDAMHNLWARFRRMYPACYTPLLADRQAADDWRCSSTRRKPLKWLTRLAQSITSVQHGTDPTHFHCAATWHGLILLLAIQRRPLNSIARLSTKRLALRPMPRPGSWPMQFPLKGGRHLQRRLQIICGNRGSANDICFARCTSAKISLMTLTR